MGAIYGKNFEIVAAPSLNNTSKMQELRVSSSRLFRLQGAGRSRFSISIWNGLRNTEMEGSMRRQHLVQLRVGNPALEALSTQYSKSSARFLLDERALSGAVGNFRKRVEFNVRYRYLSQGQTRL